MALTRIPSNMIVGSAGNLTAVNFSSVTITNTLTVSSLHSGGLTLTAGTSTWQFNTDGSTALPHYTLPSNTGTVGQYLAISTNSNILVWTTPAPSSASTSTLYNGTATLKLAADGSVILDHYTLPASTGTVGQILAITSASSTLAWVDAAALYTTTVYTPALTYAVSMVETVNPDLSITPALVGVSTNTNLGTAVVPFNNIYSNNTIALSTNVGDMSTASIYMGDGLIFQHSVDNNYKFFGPNPDTSGAAVVVNGIVGTTQLGGFSGPDHTDPLEIVSSYVTFQSGEYGWGTAELQVPQWWSMA